MQNEIFFKTEKNFERISLVLAPSLFALSSFYWENGEYGVIAGTLIVLSTFFWIPAFIFLFRLLQNKMPRYAVWGLWIAVYGCVSGICFAFLGYLTTIFKISHQEYLQKLADHPVTSQLLLFATGPLFPLSIVLLGINLIRSKTVEIWTGVLLIAGAILFPAGRITRTELYAHLADVLLIIPCIYLAFTSVKKYSRSKNGIKF